ncbi:hypothetical protein J7J64_10850 [Lysobacter sp. ISL-42]|nr:hypothetical protein [Lysobacter sp. ISL-42]MBT2750631.1 hypothetical protein [Lysobacter sp. ISL-50]MBT2776477.1 hypothetical protein [Lysobacter sp. ISL-54]MBT2780972.1 hypothetical protein [Lysobacter sp. ISL-52]
MPVLSIQLTLAHVGFGGNAGKGHYFYSFSPDVVTVQTSTPITLEYVFEDEVSSRFQIVNVLNSDAYKQIGTPEILDEGRRVRMRNQNSVSTLIFFTVLVRDSLSTYNDVDLISCDPQVGNDPQVIPARKKRG